METREGALLEKRQNCMIILPEPKRRGLLEAKASTSAAPGKRIVATVIMRSNLGAFVLAYYALRLTQHALHSKRRLLSSDDESSRSLLEPLVPLVLQCLTARHDHVVSCAVRIVHSLTPYNLPSLHGYVECVGHSKR